MERIKLRGSMNTILLRAPDLYRLNNCRPQFGAVKSASTKTLPKLSRRLNNNVVRQS